MQTLLCAGVFWMYEMGFQTVAFDSDSGRGANSSFLPQAKAGELGKKFIGGNEMKCADAKGGCGHGIFADIVDKHGFLGKCIEFPQRVVVDQWQRFTCAHAAGIDAHGKMTDKRVS